MNSRELRKAVRAGQRVYGTCVLSPSPRWPAMIAASGVDFVFIDTEHVALGRESLSWMCQNFQALGIAPIVRVPMPDPYWATMALDAGAGGIIFPYVETVEEVERLRGAVRISPLKGERMRKACDGSPAVNELTDAYLNKRNEDRLMIVNIESVPAIDALDSLLAVPGIDSILIGPHDLSINLGVPEEYDSPIFRDAVRTIFSKARERGIGAGIHFGGPRELSIGFLEDGANFMIHASDFAIVGEELPRQLNELRAAMGDSTDTAATDTTI